MLRLVRVLLGYVFFLVALPVLLVHPKLRHGLASRLGFYRRSFPEVEAGPRVWLHGASAGDILALKPLAREVQALAPEAQVVGTTITNSGWTMAQRHRDAFHAVTYVPYDLAGPVRRAVSRLAPRVLVLEYTELWPELIYRAHKAGVRLVLHNGRFSAERLGGYRWLFRVAGNLLTRFDLLLMRDEYEAERALKLGAPADRVHVTGNTKFDNLQWAISEERQAELRTALGLSPEALLWVAGSTHEGEEEHLLDIHQRLRQSHPALRLVIAPRYVERAERIVGLAARRGLSVRPRSAGKGAADVVVLDTIGELSACYSLAALVFVGGSFVLRGGQNILEPAATGKPVLFGPHMQNFTDAVLVLLGRGGIQVSSPEQLERVLADLLQNASYRQELGNLARAQVSAVRGAARRNAELIVKLL